VVVCSSGAVRLSGRRIVKITCIILILLTIGNAGRRPNKCVVVTVCTVGQMPWGFCCLWEAKRSRPQSRSPSPIACPSMATA
jgi:hypothetical protein